ncbi:MAG: M23 family metallopeptidase [Acidobacteriota bacterium]|nr:M23 family metallopeptidase [Acidobacteriota bacterium]
MKFLAFLSIGIFVWLTVSGWPQIFAKAKPARFLVAVEPSQPVNGSPVLFRVKTDQMLKSLAGNWLGHRVAFNFDSSNGEWYGFAGVDLATKAGRHALRLEGALTTGGRSNSTEFVTIRKASYPSSRLRVAKKFLDPDAETLERIKEEQSIKREVFRRVSSNRLWNGDFVAPVNNIVTEPFGVRRVFNGKLQSTHQGLDFRAALGTPVNAMNSGEVILAREMFFEGGTVVVDHGQGLLTMYLHLSEIKTKEGNRVGKGQEIALSGATGRVTSEHLHVAIRWLGTYLDPATLLTMKLP